MGSSHRVSGFPNAELENVHSSWDTERKNQHLASLYLVENLGYNQLKLQRAGGIFRKYKGEYKLQQSKFTWYDSSREPLPTLCSKGRGKKEFHCSSSYIAFSATR